jgi:hypothetical protein
MSKGFPPATKACFPPAGTIVIALLSSFVIVRTAFVSLQILSYSDSG